MSFVELDAFPTTTTNHVIVITGKVDGRVSTLEFGKDLSTLTSVQVTNKRFKLVLDLVPGRNEFIFQPYDSSANPLSSTREVITYEKTEPELVKVGNELDLHGEVLGFDRLHGEKNVSYKARLLQGARRTQDRQGTQLAMATEVSFPFSLRNIRISAQRTTYNRSKVTQPFIRVTLDAIQLAAKELNIVESPVVFDNAYPYITPTEEVSPFGNIRLLNTAGSEISPSDYEYDVVTNRIFLKNRNHSGKDLILAYNKVVSYSLSGDLSTIKSTIESDGYLNFDITETEHHDVSTDSEWILPLDWGPLSTVEDNPVDGAGENPGVYLSVSEIKTYALNEFKDTLLDEEGSGIGTTLEKYVKEVNQIDRRTWGRVIVGRDGFRDEGRADLYDHFPSLVDPIRGLWDEYNIHEVSYLGDPISNPLKGVKPNEWLSGTGTLGDLEPDKVSQDLQTFADISNTNKIPTNIIYGAL